MTQTSQRIEIMHGMAAAGTQALTVEGVSHSYGARRALANVTFSVAPAHFAVLLGLNGAGKSTLYSLITRLYGTQSGRIRIFDHDVAHEPGEALRILGVVFQSRTLDLDLSVMQNLLYHAALHGITKRSASARAEVLLARIALSDRAHDKVRSLSGGQMRRVEIARALLHRPHLLLLDEPTVGLDIRSRADTLTYVRQLVAEEGIGVLWATHLIDEVADDDQVLILHQGRLLADGLVSSVIAQCRTNDLRDAFTKLTGATSPRVPGDAI